MLFSTGRTARRLFAAVLATTFCTGPGAAMTLCLYEDYRGARTEAGAGRILGTGFQLDQEKARVRRIYGEAATELLPSSRPLTKPRNWASRLGSDGVSGSMAMAIARHGSMQAVSK